MSLKITHKYSTAADTPPASGDINMGEIAINAADAELYVKDTNGNIRKFQNTTTGTADGVQFTQAGTGAVQRTVESKLTDSISAFDFMTEDEISSVTTGTVGGSPSFLDVTSALQAALNAAAGKELILPPGIYHISSTLTVPPFTRVQGSGTSSLFPDLNITSDWLKRVPSWGYRATTIQYKVDGHGTIFNTASYCQFDGLVIRSFNVRNTTDIVFNAGEYYKFTNCVVQNMTGLMPNNVGITGACLIDGCQFTGCTRVVSGIFLDAKIINSTFTSCVQNVFTIQSGGGLNSFIGNRFDFCENAAIEFKANSRTNRVIGNNFDAHGTVALLFNETENKNIIANNLFWRCGRNKSVVGSEVYDDTNAFIKIRNSREQYFVGNVFLRGGPDSGSAWAGPAFVIGVESCVDQKNYFIGNVINRTSCYQYLPIRDDLGTSTNCIDIDSIFIGDAGAGPDTYTGDGTTTDYSITFEYSNQSNIRASLDGTLTTAFTFVDATTLRFNTAPANNVNIEIYLAADIGGPALTTGRFMTKPTVCYITEDKEVMVYANAFENLILTADTGPFGQATITFTNNGGTLAIGSSSMIDNITYGGRLYYVKNGQQYADGFIDVNRAQGNWPLYTMIYQQTPQVVGGTTYVGVIKTASATPDVWKAFGALST